VYNVVDGYRSSGHEIVEAATSETRYLGTKLQSVMSQKTIIYFFHCNEELEFHTLKV
jgi:hypothetical protein